MRHGRETDVSETPIPSSRRQAQQLMVQPYHAVKIMTSYYWNTTIALRAFKGEGQAREAGAGTTRTSQPRPSCSAARQGAANFLWKSYRLACYNILVIGQTLCYTRVRFED